MFNLPEAKPLYTWRRVAGAWSQQPTVSRRVPGRVHEFLLSWTSIVQARQAQLDQLPDPYARVIP